MDKFKLILGVTGCAQTQNTNELLLELKKKFPKIDLVVVGTPSAPKFLDLGTTKTHTGRKPFVDFWLCTKEFPVPHIDLAAWADLVLVYPATANMVASCAYGFASNLLATIVLATRSPVVFGPTMNENMFKNPLVGENLKKLTQAGYKVLKREMHPVYVHSMKQWVKKPFVSHGIVIEEVEKHYRRKIKK